VHKRLLKFTITYYFLIIQLKNETVKCATLAPPFGARVAVYATLAASGWA